MQINSYLFFDDQCEAAFKLYEQCFGGSIETLVRYGEEPSCGDDLPEAERNKIMHVCLVVNGQWLMGSDCPPSQPYEGMRGYSVSLNVDSAAEAERIYTTLAQGGTELMPLAKTFWAERFGMLRDAYGVSWMVNFEGNK